jgi:hypothetical protein
MCSDFDSLGLFMAQYCQVREDFSYGCNELNDETKARLKALGIEIRYYSSIGTGCMVRYSSDDYLTLKLAFEGFEKFNTLDSVL